MLFKYIQQINDKRFANHKELMELEELGHGLCGIAFLTKEGLVVKETKSKTEYDTAYNTPDFSDQCISQIKIY